MGARAEKKAYHDVERRPFLKGIAIAHRVLEELGLLQALFHPLVALPGVDGSEGLQHNENQSAL